MSADLNVAQREAVNYLTGPSLVLAGAGSGKTRVITHKITRLIEAGLAPKRIAAITFTNKAALEMRERTKAILKSKLSTGQAAKDMTICTFHALGARILRTHAAAAGLKQNFSILDASDVQSLLKEAASTTDLATLSRWQWTISAWKNAGLNSTEALAQAKDEDERATAVVMQRYEERLSAYQSVDFDDLINLPLQLLRHQADVLAQMQEAFGHVLVDEYQDTNTVQYDLLKLLVGERARLTVVGDDDQSIYGWRGATLENFRRLVKDYPELKVITLEQNYRSSPQILQAANNVIANNPKVFVKKLWSDQAAGEPIRIIDADDEEHEAQRIVARIQSIKAATDITSAQPREYRDFAVLYRANHLAKAFEKVLRKANIPYKVSGGISFFDRAEIKDLCAWLRLLSNNDDDPAFIRAVTTPKRGIGHVTLATLGNFANSYKMSLFEALYSPSLRAALPTRARDGLDEFGSYLHELEFRARHTRGTASAKSFLLEWLTTIDYEEHIASESDTEQLFTTKWANVLDFVDWVSKRCGGEIDDTTGMSLVGEEKTLLEVIQNVSLLSTLTERQAEENVVTLSTLHAAKGLEWPHVMLVGLSEGSLPFSRADKKSLAKVSKTKVSNANASKTTKGNQNAASQVSEDADGEDPSLTALQSGEELIRLQEERRLMYVGITRAKNTLTISWPKKKKQGRELVTAKPSRFIGEMALDVLTIKEDPRERLKVLRAEFAAKAAVTAAKNRMNTDKFD